MSKGFIWTATDFKTHKPVAGMKQLFAFNRNDAIARFKREYGKAFDTVGHYLVGNSFSQWEETDHDLVFCDHHGKYCETVRWCQNEDDYPTTTEIEEIRTA